MVGTCPTSIGYLGSLNDMVSSEVPLRGIRRELLQTDSAIMHEGPTRYTLANPLTDSFLMSQTLFGLQFEVRLEAGFFVAVDCFVLLLVLFIC